MIGKQRKPEITRMSQLQEELRNATFDKLKVFEGANSRDIEAYLRQNSGTKWFNALTNIQIEVHPTHWRTWRRDSQLRKWNLDNEK